MIDSDLNEQIQFWHERIYPILDYDETFSQWLEFCVEHGIDKSRGQPEPYNAGEDIKLADNSFSIKEDPRVHNKVDTGRCFSAIYDPANEMQEEFLSFTSEFVDSPPDLDLDAYLAYALGIDAESNEKKLYYIKNSKFLEAYTYVDNKLIESKKYDRDTMVHSIWRCEGERGHRKRIGLSNQYESDNHVADSLEVLPSINFSYERTLSMATSILNSELFHLDNIGQSVERGTTLYFD